MKTTKGKGLFKEWAKTTNYLEVDSIDDINYIVDGIPAHGKYWEAIPFSMQWGVYLDFFDSKGIYIEITWNNRYNNFTASYTSNSFMIANSLPKKFITRQEAQQAAIDKAEEILNL